MQKKRIEEISKGRTNLFSCRWRDCEPARIATQSVAGGPATMTIGDAVSVPGKPTASPTKAKLNTRTDFGNLPEFALSLADGIKESVRGYMGENGKFQITNGERRWRGAQWLEEKKGIKILLPCVRESQGYTDTDRNVDLLRTNNGKPLEMIEKAEAMKRLLDAGMKEKEIAHKAGCSVTHVVDCMALLETSPEVQSAVRKGEMTGTLAIDLARQVPDKERQSEILQSGREKAAATKTKLSTLNSQLSTPKVTAKHLPVATGKKAAPSVIGGSSSTKPETMRPPLGQPVLKPGVAAAVSAATARAQKNAALAQLEELLDAVTRHDCQEVARYDTLEFLCEYAAGRKGLATATKFILGII